MRKNSTRKPLPSELYQSACSEGLINPDNGQLEVLSHLDFVYRELEYAPLKEGLKLSSMFLKQDSRPWRPIKGLYLWGAVGRGKTYLLDLLYNSIDNSYKRRMHFHSFMQSVHDDLRLQSMQRDPLAVVARSWASDTRVLCLDEFQVSDITDAMLLSKLLEGLFNVGMTLVVTSNEKPDALYSEGLQRQRFLPAIRLLEKNTNVIEIKGETDYRLRTLESAPVYYLGEANQFNDNFAQSFKSIVGRLEGSQSDILIGGRSIEVKKVCDGIVWADFKDLCVGSRSSKDYIEIGKLYHTVLLENIPLLGHDDDDAARRFINFIDEMYDRNVNLVISAAAGPKSLYSGTRLKNHFKRTASRLIEMRSTQYLSRPHKSG